jgi:hypothetical protein
MAQQRQGVAKNDNYKFKTGGEETKDCRGASEVEF